MEKVYEQEAVASWTTRNYPKVRKALLPHSRIVFDRMADKGLRLREAADDGDYLDDLAWDWHCACEDAGVEVASSSQLRTDYIAEKYEARQRTDGSQS